MDNDGMVSMQQAFVQNFPQDLHDEKDRKWRK